MNFWNWNQSAGCFGHSSENKNENIRIYQLIGHANMIIGSLALKARIEHQFGTVPPLNSYCGSTRNQSIDPLPLYISSIPYY